MYTFASVHLSVHVQTFGLETGVMSRSPVAGPPHVRFRLLGPDAAPASWPETVQRNE